jgi:hypothetical protein
MSLVTTLDTETMTFLLALKSSGPTHRKGLPAATRRQDRARQKAKAQGLCTYHPIRGWSITERGRDAVETVAREGFP